MEKIKIAHLYYDLLNLYGEAANVQALTKAFEQNKVKVTTHFLTVDDQIDFDKYDIFYLGSGSEESLKIAYDDLMKRKEIINADLKNKLFILTGNSVILLSKNYIKLNGTILPMLGVIDSECKETNFRIVGECIMQPEIDNHAVIGFQNHNFVMTNNPNPLFKVKIGTGFNVKKSTEGIYLNNIIATTILGPLLIRNPYFTSCIVKKELEKKKIPYLGFDDPYAIKAYENYLSLRKSEE